MLSTWKPHQKMQEKLHGTDFDKLYELSTILVEPAHDNNMLYALVTFRIKKKNRETDRNRHFS